MPHGAPVTTGFVLVILSILGVLWLAEVAVTRLAGFLIHVIRQSRRVLNELRGVRSARRKRHMYGDRTSREVQECAGHHESLGSGEL